MSDLISKSKLLNRMANVHFDTEHPLESYTALVTLINIADTEDDTFPLTQEETVSLLTRELEEARDKLERTKAHVRALAKIISEMDGIVGGL